MADSSQLSTGLRKIVREHVSSNLKNTIWDRCPLLYFLMQKDGDKSGASFEGLGRPNTGMFLTGVSYTKARREQILSSRVYEPLIQTGSPAENDGKVLGMYDSMPTRSNWTTTTPDTYLSRPRFKWTEYADPYKIPNKLIRITKRAAANEIQAWKGIKSIADLEMVSVEATHVNRLCKLLWGSTGNGYPSNEDADVWDAIHSIPAALKADNTYGGVDRSSSSNSWWRGNYSSSATSMSFEDLINYCNYDLGFSKKGGGLDLILTDGPNFKKAKAEAKAKNQSFYAAGTPIPQFGQFGFSRDIVKIDNTFIVYDPFCPSGNVAALNLGTWTFATHPDANFTVSTPEDQSKIEGGDDAHTGTIRTELMIVCEVPSQNAYWTNFS